MPIDFNFMVGGEAGQGVQSVGLLLAKVFARGGYHVFADQDYESRIRGGHNFFRVRVKEDSVMARIEGHDEEFMKARLRILGYLIMHTRQLDMVMNNEAEIMHYRQKFIKEINEILAAGK